MKSSRIGFVDLKPYRLSRLTTEIFKAYNTLVYFLIVTEEQSYVSFRSNPYS